MVKLPFSHLPKFLPVGSLATMVQSKCRREEVTDLGVRDGD